MKRIEQTPERSVEEIVEELDNLANIYGWHKDTCCGHSHNPSCPVIKLRRMILETLQTERQKREEIVREERKRIKDLVMAKSAIFDAFKRPNIKGRDELNNLILAINQSELGRPLPDKQ